MGEERHKILELLSQGKITVEEAEKLLNAVSNNSSETSRREGGSGSSMPGFKYLRVQIDPAPGSGKKEKVNIRVPAKLIRAGLKWAAFMPKHARAKVNETLQEKGIDMDFEKMKPEDIEELVSHLGELEINVEGEETVKIFCE